MKTGLTRKEFQLLQRIQDNSGFFLYEDLEDFKTARSLINTGLIVQTMGVAALSCTAYVLLSWINGQ